MVEAIERAHPVEADGKRRPTLRTGAAVAAGLALIVSINSLPNGFVSDDASRGSVLATALVLVALLWWRRRRSLLHGLGALGACAAALLADEQVLPLVLVLPLADFVCPADASSGRRRPVVLYAALVVVAAGYLVLRRAALKGVGEIDETAVFQGNPAALLPAALRIVTGLKVTALAVSKLIA